MLSVRISIALLELLAITASTIATGPAPVNLGTAGNFAILSQSGVSTVPNSNVSGDVGVSPIATTALTGFSLTVNPSGQFWTSTQVHGDLMGASDADPTPALLTTAVGDMQAAYTDAMGRANPDFSELAAGLIGGLVLVPGLYKWTTAVDIATDITLSGSATDTWIFQITGTLTLATDMEILLIGGAVSSNIIWVVADTVVVGVGATFQGNILAQTDVTVETNAVDHGCIYAQTAVALQKATVLCGAAAVLPPPPSPTVTTTLPTQTGTLTPTGTSTPKGCSADNSCFTIVFTGFNGAVQAGDYITYTLVDTVEECLEFCCTIEGCVFANPHFEIVSKNVTQLTCSVFSECHTAAQADNVGGQKQPDGILSTITDSAGYCLCAV